MTGQRVSAIFYRDLGESMLARTPVDVELYRLRDEVAKLQVLLANVSADFAATCDGVEPMSLVLARAALTKHGN